MAAIRTAVILLTLAVFFLIGAPIQWLVARRAPSLAHHIPLLFCRSLLWLLKVRLTVEGTRAVDGPVMMVANHVSWIDILALGAVTPFCFLAKREVSQWPILSAFAEVQGTVFVDRARRRTIPQANRAMAARMLQGRAVLLFPEGTTIDAAEPGLFRTSHFAAARDLLRVAGQKEVRGEQGVVKVQPVAIAYSSRAAAWVGDDALLPHLWRTLRAPPLTCDVTFATPIAYGVGSDRKLIARRSRESIVDALGRRRRETSPIDVPSEAEIGRAAATGC